MTAENYRYEELTRDRFAEIAAAYPSVLIPLEQTPQWAGFERDTGREPFGIFAYFDDAAAAGTAAGGAAASSSAEPVVVASFLHSTRRLRESMVVVNGPVWFGPRTAAAERRLLGTLRSQFGPGSGVNPVFVRLQVEHPHQGVAKALEPGWYDREIVVDLGPDEKTMLAGFRPNARQSIRKATRAGVEIRTIEAADRLAVFRRELFPIMAETAARDGFSSFDSGYYETLLTSLADYTELMVAYLADQPLCWLITTEYRGYAVYYFAASTAAARKAFAPYLLLWESLKMLKARGNTACGLTGIVSDTYPSLANVTTFKRNFSKDVVVLPTTYDVPLKKLHYKALASALKLRREGLPAGRRGLNRIRARATRLLRRSGTAAGSTGSPAPAVQSGARHD
ncbi:peptidoglycan bridge formation glycyltransferase FemA/FemB family protein [Paeniglutamicibacter antarcticus]|uniref:Peptidoglycan bridge formation glycyltransferase FemA/FemB family protein n=1 Tax=Arthrobacter terrae TaxID=2935737 RepID=A0A931CN60_9MICC|nr:peptidoglycan bridge formation glycyltransferase FemA/FemB family protein [Arthrobacter terrae]MBG0738469.1 peptidoglycan bridge formation glycyltransferase FemA/FemB family protein [Arthrobacter terrae]